MTTHQGTLQTHPSRRDFLKAAWLGATAVLLAEVGGVAIAYMWPYVKPGAFGSVVELGNVRDYKVGDVKYFPEARLYVVRLEDGFMALYRKCTHLGCTVPWRPEKELFICPCHGSVYLRNGKRIAGPAPRPLDYFPLEIKEDGTLVADTSVILRRRDYDPSQATPVPPGLEG